MVLRGVLAAVVGVSSLGVAGGRDLGGLAERLTRFGRQERMVSGSSGRWLVLWRDRSSSKGDLPRQEGTAVNLG